MNKQRRIRVTLGVAAVALLALFIAYVFSARESYEVAESPQKPLEIKPVVVPIEELYPNVIAPGTTLSAALRSLKVPPATIHQIAEAAKPVNDLARLRPGTRFKITESVSEPVNQQKEIIGLKFWFSPVEMMDMRKVAGTWTAQRITEPTETRLVTFSGVVKGSLWESAEQAKMDPNLISELADIFAWEVDFAREVRVNDRWRMSVEQKLVKGQHFGWGSILAAEFENGSQTHSAVLFRMNGEKIGYFGKDGSSLRRMFLKSPLKFGRISSRFQKARFHPILKIFRPHLGVDYAAPTGTPIHAVGSGVIAHAAWSGGAGKMIRIRHNSTYETAYKHMSRFADGIKVGKSVQQGQVIGYVGSTGLSTASHLHFEFYVGGKYVDPQSQKFPSADPVPEALKVQFQADSIGQLAQLPAWQGPTSPHELSSEAPN